MIDDEYADKWRRQECQIVIAIWSRLHRTWIHRTVAIFITIFTERTAGDGPSSRSWHTGSGELRSSTHLKLHQTAGKIRGRTPRSRSDRTAIVARSNCDRGSFIMKSMPCYTAHDSNGMWQEKIPRSRPDRRLILTTIKCDRGFFWSQIEAEFIAGWKAQRRPRESLPRPLQSAPTTASIGHDLRAKFPFKSMYFPSYFLNFWSIPEEIK